MEASNVLVSINEIDLLLISIENWMNGLNSRKLTGKNFRKETAEKQSDTTFCDDFFYHFLSILLNHS